ncbi:MAG: site-specific integrase, partial [Pseudomonadales bacterium]|nr:site-specific integrase [Pseudomonadales bacterium]
MADTGFDQRLAEFRHYLVYDRSSADNTVKNYQHDLTRLQRFCIQQNLADWSELTQSHLREFSAN